MKDPVAVTEQKVNPEVAGTGVNVEYRPEMVQLYGLTIAQVSAGGFDDHGPIIRIQLGVQPNTNQIAVIYGYSFEGHCYSLPKPCVMVVRGNGVAAVGCGYNAPPGYSMWTMDKLDRTATISVEQGFIEDLILQQNVGGPKAPAAYGTRVQVAHRGGKLSE